MGKLEKHYADLLGLSAPWLVTDVKLELEARRVQIRVKWQGGGEAACPACGAQCRLYDLREERSWRHLDTMQFETIITARVPRCECPEHGVVTIETPWAGKHSRFTLMFEAFAIEVLLACQTVEAARKLLRLSWRQVDEIRMRAVERGLQRRELEEMPYLGIDEKSFGRGHDYVSVLTDVKGSRVLDVAQGRTGEAAESLLECVGDEQSEGVMAVAMDMWPSYIKAAEKRFPEAVVVHDRFHVMKLLGEGVDLVRRQENRTLNRQGDNRLKGTKHLWLRNPTRLTPNLRNHLDQLCQQSLKVSKAWHLKNLFEEYWTFEFVDDGRHFIRWWMQQVNKSRLKPMIKVAKTLLRHWNGLLGYLYHPITNACTEGFNSKIQAIKSAARGFRSFTKYRAAILFHCGKLSLFPQRS